MRRFLCLIGWHDPVQTDYIELLETHCNYKCRSCGIYMYLKPEEVRFLT